MKIYNYNRDTKEFVNQTDASPNPLTSGEWLIPANATTDAPPSVGVGKVAVWDNDSWIVKDDNRGTTVYDTTTATGYDEEIYASESLVVDYIGPIKDTHATSERPSKFHKWNETEWVEDLDAKWEDAKNTRNELLSNSDWTVLADSPLTTSKKTKWKTYRQELRDLTSTFSKTDTITWPTKPE